MDMHLFLTFTSNLFTCLFLFLPIYGEMDKTHLDRGKN